VTENLPFVRFRSGGRALLGRQRQGDVTARRGDNFDVRVSVFATRKANVLARQATKRAWNKARVAFVFRGDRWSSDV
jgi:hypothetical protein